MSADNAYDEQAEKIKANIRLKKIKRRKVRRIVIIAAVCIAVPLIIFTKLFLIGGNALFTKVDLNAAYSYGNYDEVYSKSYLTHPCREEVEAAAGEVRAYFGDRMSGQVLEELTYDEEQTMMYYKKGKSRIVFNSKIHVIINDGSTGDYWNPDWTLEYSYYYNKWMVVGCGYG